MTISLLLAAMLGGEPMTSEVTQDAITDRVRAVATLRSGDIRLEIHCTPRRLRRIWVQLVSNRWYRVGDPIDQGLYFAHRFDDQPHQHNMWHVRERYALLYGRHRIEPFVRGLLSSRQLVIRVAGPEQRSYDIRFEIEGAQEAITEALEACGDPLLARPPRQRWRLRLPRL